MISTRGRYAIRVLLDLAENDNGAYIPLKDIAERQSISKKYLEIIVKDMVTAGLLIGASGRGGGYNCPRKGSCKTLPLWSEFDKMVHDFLYGKKLSDLMTKPE